MNWCMFGACAGCIPIMLSFREKYRRLEIDKIHHTADQSNNKPNNVKTPLGSSLGISPVDETLVRKESQL